MTVLVYIGIVFAIAILISTFLARNSIKELIKFLKMDRHEKDVAIAAAKDRLTGSMKEKKFANEIPFVVFFFALSAACAVIGLDYTCGYCAFWGAMILAEGINSQIRLFIANYRSPNEVSGDGIIFEVPQAA